ncbi:MAG: Tfp pilus assembly protein FimT/FimU [Vicinamibacterales bacterium]
MSNQRGFTLAELLVAGAFFMTVTGVGMALLGSALPSVRTDGEVNRLIGILQLARETAITRQRDVEVRIDPDDNSVLVVRHEEDEEVPVRQLIFEYNVSFVQFAGMGDSPDGYGAASAVDFGEAESMIFAPDGSFLAEDNVPLNGTFFLGVAGRPETARALTVTGATARPRLYAWAADGAGWMAR